MHITIAPSILAADLGCLKEEIARAVEGGCDAVSYTHLTLPMKRIV